MNSDDRAAENAAAVTRVQKSELGRPPQIATT